MKTGIVYIISLLLLCIGCSLEIEPQFEYVETIGSNGCYTVRVRMPENLKISNAQLESHKLTVEYDRGRDRGVDKWTYSSSNRINDVVESVQFRGANRIDGFALLYFTEEEEPQEQFNPPIGTTKISSGIKEREEFAIFRTSDWLVVHYSIKNTVLGDLTFHDLTKRYARKNNKGDIASFKTIDGKMHFNLAFNNKEKRSFPIDGYYRQHETYGSSSGSHSRTNNELSWTWRYKIISNENKIIMDR